MKILTNTQSVKVGGIAQALTSFKEFLKNQDKTDIQIIGVDVLRKYETGTRLKSSRKIDGSFVIISQEIECRSIKDVLPEITSLDGIRDEYQDIISYFEKIIDDEKPDLIIINGTYFVPWCLYLAARKTDIPVILHYHGIMSKEIAAYDLHSQTLLKEMERSFDNSRLYYIFPSELSKSVVENEVFRHTIAQSAVLPNAIPEHFFKVRSKGVANNIGVVGRWNVIKNTEFTRQFIKYNQSKDNFFNINLVTDTQFTKKEDLEIAKYVRLVPPMNVKKLSEFYGQMGLILCPSHFETYGNVPQEAIAAGTPALVGPNMGVTETLRKVGLDNLITDFKSVKEVYQKAKLVTNQRIDKKIREDMRKIVSTDAIHTKLLNLYKSAVS